MQNEELFEKGSPQQFLWQQQLKNAKTKTAKSEQVVPLILKWCIALHHKSSSAYEFIRSSRIITLPHKSTLKCYTNFMTPSTGFNPQIIEEVVRQSNINKLPAEDFKKNMK